MAQPIPNKHPSTAASGLGSPLISSSDRNFTPRKEFIKDQRVTSVFALLVLSGSGFVRLYNLPQEVFLSLQRLFDHDSLIIEIQQDVPKHYWQFALHGRPWASPKSVKAEKLILDILTVVLHHGYNFLSTVDYGREHDDRVAITFSKPTFIPPGSTTALSNASAISLRVPIRTPFAISFAGPTTLRVIGAPLNSTPAILAAVRGNWPRGINDEKKIGDSIFEFKLNGYGWFQEDTFSTDSLHLILGILAALDAHGFTLMTSLTLTNRSRVRDLWIFTGDEGTHADTGTPLVTPAGSHIDLKTSIAAQVDKVPAFGGRALPIPPTSSPLATNVLTRHTRSASDTTAMSSSPLKNSSFSFGKATSNLLRLAALKGQGQGATSPIAEVPQSTVTSPAQSPLMGTSSIGSCDMTGVGSGLKKSAAELQRIPEIVYATDGRQRVNSIQEERNPFSMAFDSPYPVFRRSSDESRNRSSSVPLETPRDRRTSGSRSSISPRELSTRTSPQPQTPDTSGCVNKNSPPSGQIEGPKEPLTDAPRTSTPPLLASGVFRDSAFSSNTERQSYEIPVRWIGTYPEPAGIKGKNVPAGVDEDGRQPPSTQAHLRPDYGSSPPGAWNPSPRDSERNDVYHIMFPPTIKEQPSQEGDDAAAGFQLAKTLTSGQPTPGKQEGYVPSALPTPVRPSMEGTRKSERADINVSSNGDAKRGSPSPPRGRKTRKSAKERIDSGWVMVNVEGTKKSFIKGASPDRGRTQSPTTNSASRPSYHARSSSDSRLPSSRARSPKSPPDGGAPSQATMSAAAKAIAMVDAMDAKEQREKSKASSSFKRLLGRATGSNDGHESRNSPAGSQTPKRAPEGRIDKIKAREEEERERRRRNVPTTRSRDKRISID